MSEAVSTRASDATAVAGPRARRTAFIWSLYLLVLAVMLNVAPALLLAPFGIPAPTEVWIRLVGMFLLFLAYLNWTASRTGNVGIMRVTVEVRLTVPLFFATYVALGWVVPALLLFAVIDVVAALWTRAALRAEGLW